MATLTAQESAREANALSFDTASDGGDDFVTTGEEMLLVVSSHGDEATCTVTTHKQVDDDLDVEDREIAIAAGSTQLLGPFQKGIYGDPADSNKVTVDFGVDYADMELAVVKKGS